MGYYLAPLPGLVAPDSASPKYKVLTDSLSWRALRQFPHFSVARPPSRGFFTLWGLYHNWGIDKKRWLQDVLFTSLLRCQFGETLEFLRSGLKITELFAGGTRYIMPADMLSHSVVGSKKPGCFSHFLRPSRS